MHIKNKHYPKWPRALIAPPIKRDRSRYYYFHKDHEYDTSECWALKKQIEELIRQGKLKEFIEDTNIEKKPKKYEDSKEKEKASI